MNDEIARLKAAVAKAKNARDAAEQRLTKARGKLRCALEATPEAAEAWIAHMEHFIDCPVCQDSIRNKRVRCPVDDALYQAWESIVSRGEEDG